MESYKDIEGLKYEKTSYSPFWLRSSTVRVGENEAGMGEYKHQEGKPGQPDIYCECGSSSFSLTFGDYELFATCISCRLTGSVYSE